jgi:hypothetical protein
MVSGIALIEGADVQEKRIVRSVRLGAADVR